MRSFGVYYVRNALPFITGVAFVIIAERAALPLPVRVLLGAALVAVGPFAIQLVLTLVVDALWGEDSRGVGRSARAFPGITGRFARDARTRDEARR
ncbi:MAG: hypothetical protein WC273_10260 [Dehalococcoidia bacterium]